MNHSRERTTVLLHQEERWLFLCKRYISDTAKEVMPIFIVVRQVIIV